MFSKKISVAVVAIMAGLAPLAGSALAQDATPPAASPAAARPHRLQHKFDAANATHDGHLTLAQAQAGNMPMVARNFTTIDADHTGYVTLQEIRHFIQARRAARQDQAPAAPPAQ